MKVNNCEVKIYQDNEVVIIISPKMSEINEGRIYLTRKELLDMVDLLDGTRSKDGVYPDHNILLDMFTEQVERIR